MNRFGSSDFFACACSRRSGSPRPQARSARALALGGLVVTALALLGCQQESPPDRRPTETTNATNATEARVATAQQAVTAPVCVTILRDSATGAVVDTEIDSDAAKALTNYGTNSALLAGYGGTERRHALLRFDLSPIPASALISSANVTLNVGSQNGGLIQAHRITAPWSELSVTWKSFNGAYAAAVDASISPSVGVVSLNVNALMQAWVNGTRQNYGLLLEMSAPNLSSFDSSEVPEIGNRPKLVVCYTPNPCVGVVCQASDQCHTAGTCNTATGLCSNPNRADGRSCNDSNACTSVDTCQSGICTGTSAVTCAASDQCHAAGTCNPATGQCSDPAAANGAACNDGNACTQADSCQSGTCTGTSPVACAASDQCHAAGTCNPATGQCSDPAAANGAACNDGDACTQSDSCQSGACMGASPVACAASDACHTAGTCNSATGQCSNPNAVNGAACNDGNSCTQSDTCQSGTCTGASPVTCVASDQCHAAGTCNSATGQCDAPAVADGTSCNDGSACTQADSCQSGTCTGASPVACVASDQCHAAGTCNPATGQCSNPALANGAACNDGDGCTQSDTCQSGTCAGANPVACAAPSACHTAGTCNPATGQCTTPAAADGTACNDNNACTQSDTCQAGACSSGAPVVCTAATACTTVGACDPTTGQCSNPTGPDGTACTDGNAATEFDTCLTGVCTGANSVVITVQSPVNGAIASTGTVLLTGTISEPATVTIGTVNAAVNGLTFSANVTLHEGNNIIALGAKSALGNPGSTSVIVIHDSTPPRVAITAPANNAIVAGNTATVTGTVQDLLIGTVNPGDCSVMVNGVAATVENRGFRAVNVPIAEGAGTITAIATDLAGNTASAVFSVTGSMASNAMIFAAGGDAQSGTVATTLAQPFTAFVADNTGAGMPGIPVTFKVTRSNGMLANGKRSETVTSNAQGFAATTLKLGSTTGAASDQVVATAAAFLGAATFAADGLVDPVAPRVLTVGSGGLQRGAIDTLASEPLSVLLADDKGNPITGQNVTFTVKQGGGRINGASTVTRTTDTDGRAFVLLTLGATAGDGSQLVEATAAGANEVQFIASTVIAGPPASTHVSGVVMTNENDPILNVNVRIKGTPIQMLTDAEGHFDLVGAPVGPIHLEINGGTAGPYPTISFDLTMISGVDNPMDRPIYLPTVDTNGLGTANPTADLVLRRGDVPGLVLTVAAGSATFNGVAKTGTVQIVNVHNDKLPMLPSDGAMPTQAFAIMPHGATFNPPAAIRFPNVDGRAPGEVVQIYSYDHDLSAFVVVGTAQVSEDGLEIASEAGQGIVKGGWHYIPPVRVPPTTACVGGNFCDSIKSCTRTSAVAPVNCVLSRQSSAGLPTGTATTVPVVAPWNPDAQCYKSAGMQAACQMLPNCMPAVTPSQINPNPSCIRGYNGPGDTLDRAQGRCVVPTVNNVGIANTLPALQAVCCPNNLDGTSRVCNECGTANMVCCASACNGPGGCCQ